MPPSSLNENPTFDIPNALPTGTTLRSGDYVIENAIGRGGFAITYHAQDTGLHRAVAIKEFFPQGAIRDKNTLEVLAASTHEFEQAKEQFLHEARALAQFKHDNIVHVNGVFEENATAYLAMEWVNGEPLSMRGPLAEDEVKRIAGQIGAALTVMHEAGMLHLDITPGNIMVDEVSGRAVLLDFGLSKRIQSVVDYATVRLDNLGRFGTPGFAAIEQYTRTGELGVYTDVYGFAATLYFLLTGQEPPEAAMRASGSVLQDARSLNPAVSASFAEALECGLRLPPEERPSTIAEFLQLIEKPRATLEVIPAPDPAPPLPVVEGEVLPRTTVHRRRVYTTGKEIPAGLTGPMAMLPFSFSCGTIGCSIGCFVFIAAVLATIGMMMSKVGDALKF